jgi:formate hydrogenlyase subunit 6/NADH:ubiquinone oxidoreductase subunit I
MCAVICPEAIIEVQRDDNIVAIEPKRKSKADLLSLKGGTG